MKTFSEHIERKDLVNFIVENNIDVDLFCELTLDFFENKRNINEENLNEFLSTLQRGIQKAARGASGLFGGLYGVGKDAASGVVGAAQKAGGAIAGAARQAGGAITGAAKQAGQYVGKQYEAGRKAEAIRQVNDRINGLENALVSLGLNKNDLNSTLTTIKDWLLKAVEKGRIGQVRTHSQKDWEKFQDYQKQQAAIPPKPWTGTSAIQKFN